jgi:hypothetical protein
VRKVENSCKRDDKVFFLLMPKVMNIEMMIKVFVCVCWKFFSFFLEKKVDLDAKFCEICYVR